MLRFFLGLFQYSPIFWKVHRDFCHSMTEFLANIFENCSTIPFCAAALIWSSHKARPSTSTGITFMYHLLQKYNTFISFRYILSHKSSDGPHQYVLTAVCRRSFLPLPIKLCSYCDCNK
jgi:hypothetical protein